MAGNPTVKDEDCEVTPWEKYADFFFNVSPEEEKFENFDRDFITPNQNHWYLKKNLIHKSDQSPVVVCISHRDFPFMRLSESSLDEISQLISRQVGSKQWKFLWRLKYEKLGFLVVACLNISTASSLKSFISEYRHLSLTTKFGGHVEVAFGFFPDFPSIKGGKFDTYDLASANPSLEASTWLVLQQKIQDGDLLVKFLIPSEKASALRKSSRYFYDLSCAEIQLKSTVMKKRNLEKMAKLRLAGDFKKESSDVPQE